MRLGDDRGARWWIADGVPAVIKSLHEDKIRVSLDAIARALREVADELDAVGGYKAWFDATYPRATQEKT